MITLPLTGTYNEFYDIYREVLTKNDQHDVLERLENHINRAPDAEAAGKKGGRPAPSPAAGAVTIPNSSCGKIVCAVMSAIQQ